MSELPEPEFKPPGRRITLAGLLVIMVVIISCAALLIPALNAAKESANRASCQGNLGQMYKAMYVYVIAFGKNKNYMPHIGDAFFTCLLGHAGPDHPTTYNVNAPCYGNTMLYVCPSSGSDCTVSTSVTPGGVMDDYRGPQRHPEVPATILSALADGIFSGYPIACDEPQNHKGLGGNVLRFDGSVSFRTDMEYTDAYNMCSD